MVVRDPGLDEAVQDLLGQTKKTPARKIDKRARLSRGAGIATGLNTKIQQGVEGPVAQSGKALPAPN